MPDQVEMSVNEILKDLSSLSDVRKLFAELNYDVVDDYLSTKNWGKTAKAGLAGDPRIIARHRDFQVIYCRLHSPRLHKSAERAAVNKLLKQHPYALFVFSNNNQSLWHFVNVKHDSQAEKRRLFRRITLGHTDRVYTATKRLSMLDLDKIGDSDGGIPPLDIQEAHDKAFDVEEVTEQFFEDYKEIFWQFQDGLESQTDDKEWAHDYAQQFLNRLMFLYFIQQKGWLGKDTEFLASFWKTYRDADQPEDTFVPRWLDVLFFEAFNNKKNLLNTQKRAYLPENIRQDLWDAPFLNGGLFKGNKLDRQYPDVCIDDDQFKTIFKFLERYNFTIDEGSPIDQEVAVDPEMIGKVYESLVNVSSEADERSEAGIFYTPRTEIDMMCRLSLVDNLANHLGDEHKDRLYEVIFALEPSEKEEADRRLAEVGLWPEVEEYLRRITVVDPACGSGSFLVGMLQIIDNLLERAARAQGHEPTETYERRRHIIGRSLYGVDVMEWACHVAELRLWLALVVDAEFTREELQVRKDPLLPNFTFNIRCGDSLVQEIQGINLHHSSAHAGLSRSLKNRLNRLKKAKRDYYNNSPDARLKTDSAIKKEEQDFFRDMLEEQSYGLEEEIKRLKRMDLENPPKQTALIDDGVPKNVQLKLNLENRKKKIERLDKERGELEQARRQLKGIETLPFAWNVAFAEIMELDTGGFDIVIGNPPYVRQENIADPKKPADSITSADKRKYKQSLERAVFQSWPQFFDYKAARDQGGKDPRKASGRNLSRRSDLYIYFYFVGLSLVGEKGIFCFITSNSWLDVGYGADLQEFLLKHCHVRKIIDNEVQRSFKSADVNTIIAVLEPLGEVGWEGLKREARFVMTKLPFEQIGYPGVVFEEIEKAEGGKTTPEYRVRSVSQEKLLEESWEWPEDTKEKEFNSYHSQNNQGKYSANKWGGKYLRAPDIYWKIMEKAGDNLVQLGEVAEVRRGFTTGANDFFYLNKAEVENWDIEDEFLKPIIKSPKECKSILVEPNQLDYYVFTCHKTKQDLKGTNALKYIEWGEKQVSKRRQKQSGGIPLPQLSTLKSREYWYSIDMKKPGDFFCNRFFNDRFFFSYSKDIVEDQTFYAGRFLRRDYPIDFLMAILNCSIVYLTASLFGRVALGEGVLQYAVYDMKDLIIIDPWKIDWSIQKFLQQIFKSLKRRPIKRVDIEMRESDRQELDRIIFGALGLTQTERDAVYEAVIDLVEARLNKAESL